ncbi:hypothetical protein SO802_012481 [Lithocarpus litseifolius]|uniref:Uncharacterized protein n=1 Tax=Lithocarpus litseifolius TaxID=425828 RepID=A0AAW2D2W7_9ROSI
MTCQKTEIKASSFKITDVEIPASGIIEQCNFANKSLHIIGQQLDRIEEKIVEQTISIKLEKPLIDLPSQKEKISFKTSQQKTLDIVDKMLSDLKVKIEGTTSTSNVAAVISRNEDSRESIKHAVKKNDDGFPIFDEKRASGIPDGVNTLVYTILKHFVGTLTNVSSRVSDYLNNLRCPTMSNYRCCQAVFLSRVMLWKDCKKPYWKEKFLDGLPPIFAHKQVEYYDFLRIEEKQGKSACTGLSSRQKAPGGATFCIGRSTSLQESIPTEVTFSSGDMVIALQEVLSKKLQFHNGAFSELPTPVKVLLDNLQAAYTINHRKLFKKTLQALEIHIVNLIAQNEVYEDLLIDLSSDKRKPVNQPFPHNEAFASHPINHDLYTSQLFGKEEIHSMDKMTIMGIDFAKLSLKTQFGLRCSVANLPSDIQKCILDVDDNVFIQLNWEEYFGKSSQVYERKMHPFPSLLINYEDSELDKEDMDPDWLSQMFEFCFIRMIRVSNRGQINQLSQIIQQVVAQNNSLSITIRCWSTIPKWENDNWMNVQPSKHLILVNGYTHQGPWLSPWESINCFVDYFQHKTPKSYLLAFDKAPTAPHGS